MLQCRLLACHLDWLPGLHSVLPVIHLPGSLCCNLDPWWCFTCWYLLTASQCVFLWIRLLFLVSASALKESLCKLFPGHIPFFFIFVTSSRISCLLCFTTCWQWEGFAWRQCYRFCGLCIPRQIANGVCTIEQVKLAASVWFSEDERDAGFRFTYQPGLVSS